MHLKTMLMGLLVVFLLVGCGISDTTHQENRRQFELVHNTNILRIRHFDDSTKVLFVTYSYHSPAYYWYERKDSTIGFFWKIIDIRDRVLFLPVEMTDFTMYNRLDNTDYDSIMQEAVEYYKQE